MNTMHRLINVLTARLGAEEAQSIIAALPSNGSPLGVLAGCLGLEGAIETMEEAGLPLEQPRRANSLEELEDTTPLSNTDDETERCSQHQFDIIFDGAMRAVVQACGNTEKVRQLLREKLRDFHI
jgi:hypothetical protein